jgi:alkanesulfonate monooxygenase SsuD/methylene tetrahydromethanopterin reductase-like flavin-dependent oxidoreductase (luciferase family)
MLDQRMIFGLRLDGLPLARMAAAATLAEEAGLDFVLIGDPDREVDAAGDDPLSVAAFLTAKTRSIGLVSVVPQSWAPFNAARALASMDHLSGGRCGWLPLPGAEPDAEGRDAEHLDVVRQLFDSWDDDALVFDKAASVFVDRDKVRRIRHAGVHFTVDGPLNAPRPIQGHPVLMRMMTSASPSADILIATSGISGLTRPAHRSFGRSSSIPPLIWMRESDFIAG